MRDCQLALPAEIARGVVLSAADSNRSIAGGNRTSTILPLNSNLSQQGTVPVNELMFLAVDWVAYSGGLCYNKLSKELGGTTMKIKRLLAALLAACMCFTLFACGKDDDDDEDSKKNSTYQQAIDDYLDVFYKENTSKIEDLAPKSVWKSLKNDNGYTVKDAKQTLLDKGRKDIYEDRYGKNYKVSVTVIEEKKMSDETLESYGNNVSNKYDLDPSSITDGYSLTVDLTLKGSKSEYTDNTFLYALKIEGGWYLCDYRGKMMVEYIWNEIFPLI